MLDVKTFCDILKYIPFNVGSLYNNIFPYNCLFNHGDYYTADCWNLIKALIWNDGKLPQNKGEYIYQPNKYGLGDWNGATILSKCTDVSTNFTKAIDGEFILTEDGTHAGIYVGEFNGAWNGKKYTWNVIECTPIWENGIQATWVDTNGTRRNHKDGASAGRWHKHGKLTEWVNYNSPEKEVVLKASKDATKIVIELI